MAKAKFHKSELTVSETNAKNKNFLGVLVSILVLTLISSVIVAAIVIINPEIVNMSDRHHEPREAFTIEESMLNELSPAGFTYQWLKTPPIDHQRVSFDELLYEDSKNINLMTLPPAYRQDGSGIFSATITALVKNTSLLASVDYTAKLSPSHRYLLIATAKRRQFRYTSTARFYLYDNKLDLILMLSTKQTGSSDDHKHHNDGSSPPTNPPHNTFEQLDSAVNYLSGPHSSDSQAQKQSRFQVVEWFSSAGRDSLLLIQDNDIYMIHDVESQLNNESDSAKQIQPFKITDTGKANEIFNGVPDWLYEEEILNEVPAYQMSQNGDTLAYMSFNDSQVDLMPFTYYGPAEQILPTEQHIRYPKAGRVNPSVSVHLVDGINTNQFNKIGLHLPENLAQQQHYIQRIKWLTNDHISILWLNRNQNEAFVVLCSRQKQWACEKNLRFASEDGWLDLFGDQLHPLNDEYYLAPLPKYEGFDVGTFKHIAKASLNRPNEFTFLTSGKREVTSIDGVNSERGLVYYTATVVGEPGQRQAYAVHVESPEREGQPTDCITCSHYPAECLYNSIKMSPSTSYYIFECEGPGVPKTELRAIAPKPSQLLSETSRYFPVQSNASKTMEEAEPMNASPSVATALSDSSEYKNPNFINLPSWKIMTEKWISALVANTSQSKLHKNNSGPLNGMQRQSGIDDIDQVDQGVLLWTIEDNQVLKYKLTHKKAMPITVRLKVPISNTSYMADVLLMLPPQLGSTYTFRGPSAKTSGPVNSGSNGRPQRDRRSPLPTAGQIEQEPHRYFTLDSINNYISQLSSGQQYPMVVDVYAGPGSQKVDYRFNINFGHYLTSARRTIYCMIDGRGSGFQGSKRLFELYHKFGTVEIQDQIDVVGYLARNFSFIDSSKVAIWGWSYGGYVSAMALAQSNAARNAALREHHLQAQVSGNLLNNNSATTNGRPMFLTSPTSSSLTSAPSSRNSGVFECAVSVAPVTNWIYYDTAYTERYMSSPYANGLYDSHKSGDHKAQEVPASPFLGRSLAEANQPDTNKWLRTNHTSEINYRVPFSDFWTAKNSHQLARRSNNRIDPEDLNDRYKTGSLLDRIGDIDRKRFLLVHGTADDNVHFQQSIMLMKKLIQKNIMFETRVYPDQDHGILNRADKIHLGSTLSNFFAECFDMAY